MCARGDGCPGRPARPQPSLLPFPSTSLPRALLPTLCSAPPASPLYRTVPLLQCVQACATKFMKHSARVGLRFGELSSEAESQMQQMVQQQQQQHGGK